MNTLRSRFIPTLLYSNKGFVKTFNFKNPKYLGDPINIIKIFNEKEVDELTIFDIDSSSQGKTIDYEFLKKLSRESKMPICYGGGITNADQAEKIISMGIEKISINTAYLNNPNILEEISKRVGSQSVVLTLDIKKKFGNYFIYKLNGSLNTKKKLSDVLKSLNYHLVGEVVINCIHRDGTKEGFDINLIKQTYNLVKSNYTVVGGCSGFQEIEKIFSEYYPIGLGAGSFVVFKGKYNAVLISYPTNELLKFHFNK